MTHMFDSICMFNILPSCVQEAAFNITNTHNALVKAKKLDDVIWEKLYRKNLPLRSLKYLLMHPIPKCLITEVLSNERNNKYLDVILSNNVFDTKVQEEIFEKHKHSQTFVNSILTNACKLNKDLMREAFSLSTNDASKILFLLVNENSKRFLLVNENSKKEKLIFSESERIELTSRFSDSIETLMKLEDYSFWDDFISKNPSTINLLKTENSFSRFDSSFIISCFKSIYASELDFELILKFMHKKDASSYKYFLQSAAYNVCLDPKKILTVLESDAFLHENKSILKTPWFEFVKETLEAKVSNNLYVSKNNPCNLNSLTRFALDCKGDVDKTLWLLKNVPLPENALEAFRPGFFSSFHDDTRELFKLFKEKLGPISEIEVKENSYAKPLSFEELDTLEVTSGYCKQDNGSFKNLPAYFENIFEEKSVAKSVALWETLFVLAENYTGSLKDLAELAKNV